MHLGVLEKRKVTSKYMEGNMTRLPGCAEWNVSSKQNPWEPQIPGASWQEVRTHHHHLCVTSHCSAGWYETSEPAAAAQRATLKADRQKKCCLVPSCTHYGHLAIMLDIAGHSEQCDSPEEIKQYLKYMLINSSRIVEQPQSPLSRVVIPA